MIRENQFQEHPLRLLRKRLSRIIITLLIRSLNQRSHIFATTMEHLDTLIQITISGQPLNQVIMCHLLGAKINSNSLQPLLENFLRLSCYSLTSMDSTFLLIHLNKGLCKRKIFHPSLSFGRKKIPSDSFTLLISCMVGCCGLSQSSFRCFVCLF